MIGTGLADRVRETSTTTGTGTLTLDGAITGYRTFVSGFGDTTPCLYVIHAADEWEVGIGVVGSPDQLTRQTVLQSSNSGALVNFSAGEKDVFGSRVEASTGSQLVLAGETISARESLYLELYGGGRTVGRAYKTDAKNHSTSVQAVLLGFAVNAATAGQYILARRVGNLAGFTSLTAGAPLYLSNTAGAVTATKPANARQVAIAISTTEIYISDYVPPAKVVADDNTGSNLGIIGHGMYGNGRAGSAYSVLRGNTFDYLDLLSGVGNAAARGTTSPATSGYGTIGSADDGFFCGGAIGTTSMSLESAISVFDRYLSTGNATDTGDLTQARAGLAGVQNATRGFLAGGTYASGISDVIDLLTFATFTTTTSDAGDMLTPRTGVAGASAASDGFIAGGENTGYQSLIDAIDLTTGTQDATDRGDLTERKGCCAGLSGAEATIGGGMNGEQYVAALEQIDSLTYSAIALSRGELTQARAALAAASVSGSGVFAGGTNGVECLLIEILDADFGVVNVSDRGELSYARSGCAGL